MSSRAVNPELLKALWDFNHQSQNWSIKPYAPRPRRGRDVEMWAGGRTRRLLHAIYTIAFWCLLRIDEALRIQIHDLEVVSSTCIKLTLQFRKTDQFGGASTTLVWDLRVAAHCFSADIKPFYLHRMHESNAYMCPVRALSDWVVECGYAKGYLFRRIYSGDRVSSSDRPVVRFLIRIFHKTSINSDTVCGTFP
jgi:hypothetical protein